MGNTGYYPKQYNYPSILLNNCINYNAYLKLDQYWTFNMFKIQRSRVLGTQIYNGKK